MCVLLFLSEENRPSGPPLPPPIRRKGKDAPKVDKVARLRSKTDKVRREVENPYEQLMMLTAQNRALQFQEREAVFYIASVGKKNRLKGQGAFKGQSGSCLSRGYPRRAPRAGGVIFVVAHRYC